MIGTLIILALFVSILIRRVDSKVSNVAFRLPNFNLTVNVWTDPNAPGAGPPDVVTTGNLCIGLRHYGVTAGNNFIMYLLFPMGVDIRDNLNGPGVAGDIVECPAGTLRYYRVEFVESVARGFANEHRYAMLSRLGAWPVPLP